MAWKLTSILTKLNLRVMYLYKCILFTLLCSTSLLNGETNDTVLNNETDTTEFSMCENVSSSCYSHTTELTTDLSFFPMEENTSMVTRKATILIDSTTSLPPSTTPWIKKKMKEKSQKNCPCDITSNMCDINCCCDNDCNTWENNAFLKCIQFLPQPSFGQCISTDVIYKNNTPFPTTRSVSGLLCISKDNFPERNAYIDLEVIKSIQVFERVWKRKMHYYWLLHVKQPVKKLEKTELYKFGDSLWKYTNSTGEAYLIEFPASTTSTLCQRKNSISYLKDYKSTCTQISPKTREECIENEDFNAKTYCQDLVLVSSPSHVNSSMHLADSPDEVFTKVKMILCHDDYCNETNLYPEPFFDSMNNSCGNILRKVELIIYHNGSIGISHAICKVTLHLVLPQKRLFEQNFEVTYLPARLLNTSVVFRRSGTPGYRTGLPVLTRFFKESENNKINFLTVISGKGCASTSPVLFRENLRIQCIYNFPAKLTSNCSFLEEQIIHKMLKGVGEVGVTGDPDTWLDPPFTLVMPRMPGSTCSSVTSLSLDFLYSYKGSLLSPEAKIVGLMSRFDSRQKPACNLLYCSLHLVTTVSFTDISRPVLSKYASAPVVRIKLPKDFFYPFSSSRSSSYENTKYLLIINVFFLLRTLITFIY